MAAPPSWMQDAVWCNGAFPLHTGDFWGALSDEGRLTAFRDGVKKCGWFGLTAFCWNFLREHAGLGSAAGIVGMMAVTSQCILAEFHLLRHSEFRNSLGVPRHWPFLCEWAYCWDPENPVQGTPRWQCHCSWNRIEWPYKQKRTDMAHARPWLPSTASPATFRAIYLLLIMPHMPQPLLKGRIRRARRKSMLLWPSVFPGLSIPGPW